MISAAKQMAIDYSKKVMDNFTNPRNMGKIDDADGAGKAGNIACGDEMIIYIKVQDNKIKDIKFEAFGCAAAIATSSMITEMAKGKTLEEAKKISLQDIAQELDGLPPIKMHCSGMAAEALRNAIEDHEQKSK